jgi:hypothetical protein
VHHHDDRLHHHDQLHHHDHRDDRPPGIALRIDAGPDAGRTVPVASDSIVLGRASGLGRIEDPFLEAHHLLISSRGCEVIQLAGRIAVRVDGDPIDRRATLRVGSVIEAGSTRIAVVSTADEPIHPRVDTGAVVLGVGRRHPAVAHAVGDVREASFTELAADQRVREMSPISVDLRTVRRLLVTGPSAAGLVRSIIHQGARRHRIVVTDRVAALGTRPRRGRVIIVIDPDPDADWPDDELPPMGW